MSPIDLGVVVTNFIDWTNQEMSEGNQFVDVEINSLIAQRLKARNEKNWAESDRIRDELAAMGIQLKDAKDPDTGEIVTTWEVKS